MIYNWEKLLTEHNQLLVDDKKIIKNFFGSSDHPGTLLQAPATQQEIDELETRLSIVLPPSYKQFLLVSNGFKIVNQLFGDILPTYDVKRLIEYDRHFVNIWADEDVEITDEMYSIYGEGQRTEWIRGNYLKECIAVSRWFNGGIILLNPTIEFGEEYEAWQFANWYPGAARYKSFWELVSQGVSDYLRLKDL